MEKHSFICGKSTISASVALIQSIDRKEKVIVVFVYLAQDFNSVQHNTLLNTLKNLGIKNRSFAWCESCITEIKQFIEINHLNNSRQLIKVNSPLISDKYGVPQGTILGPLFFMYSLNGLPNLIGFMNIVIIA